MMTSLEIELNPQKSMQCRFAVIYVMLLDFQEIRHRNRICTVYLHVEPQW